MSQQPSTTSLGAGLKIRHLTMMGLGSSIGAGLFLGTGVGIAAAGPAVLIAYIIAGAIVSLVMMMLGELAAARPASGSFSIYGEQAFGHWAGFTLGWLYWFMLTMVLGAEMTGAAGIMAGWFGVAPWIPALVCVAIFAVINLANVRGFGEFEFWFAFIKIAVIIFFLVVGVLLIFGWLPNHQAVGTEHFLGHGFMPHGISGVATGLLAVAFAFGGIEIITIAAAESEDPKHAISVAVRTVIWRISVFYLGSVLIICFLLPFDRIQGADSAAESPFTIILGMANVPAIVGLMEGVIVLALLSAFNAQIYATSRLIHSLAERGDAPSVFARTNHQSVPQAAVLLSMCFAFGSVGLQYWNPPGLLEFLLNAVGGCLVVIWAMIALSYLKLHPAWRRSGELTGFTLPAFPWLPILTLVALACLVLLMLSDAGSRAQITSVAVIVGAILAAAFVTQWGKQKRASSPTERR